MASDKNPWNWSSLRPWLFKLTLDIWNWGYDYLKIVKLTDKWISSCLENSQCCQWRPGQTEEIKSETHKTFPLSYPLSATITPAAIELKFINVLALVFYLINCSWRNQRHFKSLTPRNFHPRYFQSLSQFVSWCWFTSRSNFMFIVNLFRGADSRRDRTSCSSSNASSFKSRERRQHRAAKSSRSSW